MSLHRELKVACVSVALSLLSTAVSAGAGEPKLVLPGSTVVIPFPGHETSVLADVHDAPSGTAVLELTVPPRTFGAPPHIHSAEDEYFYVLEGRVDFLEREQVVSGTAGTMVVLPRGHLHGFWNSTDEPARLLLVIAPGAFAGFFDAVVAEIRATNVSDPSKVAELIARAAAQRSVQVLPEKIPAAARELLPP